ncbi:CaiB/BaiF CoA transferase family protein [Ramlibacter sp.]|uniref:CaiB/BaiF CoA transferase family protein n=1 Tax=Ramlibacter sp. TaxID=1917967 RepID=UPI003D0AAB70
MNTVPTMEASPPTSERARLPLAGIRVVEFSTMVAGPFCSAILGEFGAEIIKVEQPDGGDAFRRFGTMTESGSTLNWLNEGRNKKSVTLDLRQVEGARVAKELIAVSDVVIENFRPGTMERWGLGEDVLRAIRPELIFVRVSAYGQTGPYKDRPGFARVAHGFAGLSFLAGEAGGPPVIPGSTSLADYVTGLYAAVGALVALIGRGHSGGQMVDIGLYEGVFRMLDELAPAYARTGFVRERMGADTVNAVPHSHYETKDGHWVALACTTDRMFARLAEAMGRPELAGADSYGHVDRRVEHRDEVNRLVADWIKSLPRAQLLDRCFECDVPIGPLNSVADIFADPHYKARGNLVTMRHPQAGDVTVPNVVPRLSRTPGRLDTLGPALGEHNDEIYRGLLKLDADRLETLRAASVI